MKYLISLALTLILVYTPVSADGINQKWIEENYSKREVMILMRDGARLYTVVYEPKDHTVKHPIIFCRTPYSCQPYGPDRFSSSLWNSMKFFALHHYIIVYQDVRGTYRSEGIYENIRPFIPKKKGKVFDEASDVYDTTDWLLRHTHNNGQEGVMGTSYPGFYALMAGLSGHPAIKAISPQAPVSDWFMGDDEHHNGAFCLVDTYRFDASFDVPHHPNGLAHISGGIKFPNDIYTDYLKMGPIRNFTRTFGDSVRFWNTVMDHPDRDTFWVRRTPLQYCKAVKPAVLVVGGLFDAEDCYGAWNLYKAIKKQSPKTPLYLTFGPWYHGGWNNASYQNLGQVWFGDSTSAYFMKNIEFPFFDYYLNHNEEAKPKYSVNIYFSGENHWYHTGPWPLPNVQMEPLYLHADGKLSFSQPEEQNACRSYISDPTHPVPYTADIQSYRNREYMASDQRFASARPDVQTYTSDILQDTLRLGGPLDVELQTAISSTDADFVVKLIDVYPDGFTYSKEIKSQLPVIDYPMGGYQMFVRGDIMRGKFRDGFDREVPFTPDKITRVTFRMNDIAHTFLPGHRLMVQVQSSCFPLFDRNPQTFTNIYTCGESAFKPCSVNIYSDKDHASYIMIPVLKGKI